MNFIAGGFMNATANVSNNNQSSKSMTPDPTFLQDPSLSIFQKVLLTTDGTVTNLLSLYTDKKIKVKKIDQEMTFTGAPEALFTPPETPLLRRRILLGCEKENYMYADSFFVFENLPRSIQYQLLETDRPIGLLWREARLETYREILTYEREENEEVAGFFGMEPTTPLLSRTYLIHCNQTTLGILTEKFPANFFQ